MVPFVESDAEVVMVRERTRKDGSGWQAGAGLPDELQLMGLPPSVLVVICNNLHDHPRTRKPTGDLLLIRAKNIDFRSISANTRAAPLVCPNGSIFAWSFRACGRAERLLNSNQYLPCALWQRIRAKFVGDELVPKRHLIDEFLEVHVGLIALHPATSLSTPCALPIVQTGAHRAVTNHKFQLAAGDQPADPLLRLIALLNPPAMEERDLTFDKLPGRILS